MSPKLQLYIVMAVVVASIVGLVVSLMRKARRDKCHDCAVKDCCGRTNPRNSDGVPCDRN